MLCAMTHLLRLADGDLGRDLGSHPAVLLVGPRGCGKTALASRHANDVARLDVPAEAALFRADPDAGLASRTGRPLLLDEWQEVPEIMGAAKRAVDADARPGSFLLTGSVRAGTSPQPHPTRSQPGAQAYSSSPRVILRRAAAAPKPTAENAAKTSQPTKMTASGATNTQNHHSLRG